MRTYAISLKGSTQQERLKLHDFLVSKKEHMYADTNLTKKSYHYSYFLYSTEYKHWLGGLLTTDFSVISIDDFIAKFQEPKINIRDYCIDCNGSTYSERRQIIAYLDSISEPIYSGTAFRDYDDDLQEDTIFGYDTEEHEWMTGVTKSSYTLTTKEFIAKFINTGDTMSTINVGDVYLNSAGKACTIASLPTSDSPTKVYYRHQDGKVYTTGIGNIDKNWTKQTVKPIIANLQPGTKVRVRPDLSEYKDYYMSSGDELASATKDMVKRASTIVTIDKLNRFRAYCIKEDNGCYNWTDEMFSEIITTTEEQPTKSPLAQPTTCKFKVGDMVKLKDNLIDGNAYNGITYYKEFSFTELPITTVSEYCNYVTLSNTFSYGQDALELVPQTLEERITKQLEDLVAQQEPIKSIKKEESFMSKLKATAITTIDQNKEAAIIAAKMEAGRVINKQVIKQAAKHVPFWAKGYLDTPLAPVVLANAVAMLGNHTGNAKVQKVSELMLLAAADVTVQSFNLDKIIDDVLSGIKIPAGILDDAE